MKELRLEVNLDVKDNVNVEELINLVKWAVNVYGVERVQSVIDVSPRKPKAAK